MVLEALLFLNYPFWDRLAAVSSLLPLPKESALQLGSALFGATLLCHVGPATLASRWRPPPRLSQMLGAWILLGNLLSMGLLAFRFDGSTPYLVLIVLAPVMLFWAIYDKHPGLSEAPAFPVP